MDRQMGPAWSKAVQYQQAIRDLIVKKGNIRLLAGTSTKAYPLPEGFTKDEWLLWSGTEIARICQEADTYTISESVARAVLEAAKSLPDTASIQPYHFPTKCGLVYLEAPIDAGEFYSSEMVAAAIKLADPGVESAKVQAILWNTLSDPDGYKGTFLWAALDLSDKRGVIDSTFPLSSIQYGVSFGEVSQKDFSAGKRVIAFTMALLFFMEQKVFVTASKPLTRAQRKQAPQWYKSQEERVITLRKREYTNAPSGDHREVDWQYQWLVRGHWRQQYYPARNEHRTIWITPYSKGPEDKPLKPSRNIFQVVR